jgi:hypothetical protein
MAAEVAVFLLLCNSIATAQPQTHQWVNQELRAKGIDSEQYQILGRGDLAYCTADAQQTVRRTFTIPDCTAAFSSPSPFFAQECAARQEAAKRDSAQMYKDLTLGCMARRGWLWARTTQ